MKTTLTILFTVSMLAGTGLAQRQVATYDVSSAQAFFRKGDRDSNGSLSVAEATALGITRRQALTYDADGNGRIDKSEFYVAYRAMAISGGGTVKGDLNKEVTRVLAARKAAKDKADAEARAKGTKRIDGAKDKADARTKGTERIQGAKDKADAKARAKGTKRISDAKGKAAAEARRKAEADKNRRRQGSGVRTVNGKRPKPVTRRKPAPKRRGKSRIGG